MRSQLTSINPVLSQGYISVLLPSSFLSHLFFQLLWRSREQRIKPVLVPLVLRMVSGVWVTAGGEFSALALKIRSYVDFWFVLNDHSGTLEPWSSKCGLGDQQQQHQLEFVRNVRS